MNYCAAELGKPLLKEIADRLITAERDRVAIDPTAAQGRLSAADAYRIQMINVERRLSSGRRIVGGKVGLTSLAMQKMLGVNEPDFGHLFDDMILASGDDCQVSSLMLPRVEPEIAFVRTARSVLSRAKLTVLLLPGIGTRDDLKAANAISARKWFASRLIVLRPTSLGSTSVWRVSSEWRSPAF